MIVKEPLIFSENMTSWISKYKELNDIFHKPFGMNLEEYLQSTYTDGARASHSPHTYGQGAGPAHSADAYGQGAGPAHSPHAYGQGAGPAHSADAYGQGAGPAHSPPTHAVYGQMNAQSTDGLEAQRQVYTLGSGQSLPGIMYAIRPETAPNGVQLIRFQRYRITRPSTR